MYLMESETKNIISKHYQNDRIDREDFIKKHLGGDGYIVDGFIVDRHHKDGLEVHSLTDKGVFIIHNLASGKLCTKLLARPNQIIRFYESTGREKPPEYEDILRLARLHKKLGYHEM